MSDFGQKNYYEMLGVERNASTDEIKESYRGIARVLHPDSNFFDDIVEIDPTAEQSDKFKMVTAAYHTLIDREKRALYDANLPPELPSWDDDIEAEQGYLLTGGKKYYYSSDGDLKIKDVSSTPTWNAFGKIEQNEEKVEAVVEEVLDLEVAEREDEEAALLNTSSRWGSGSFETPTVKTPGLLSRIPKVSPLAMIAAVMLLLLIGVPATILLFR